MEAEYDTSSPIPESLALALMYGIAGLALAVTVFTALFLIKWSRETEWRDVPEEEE